MKVTDINTDTVNLLQYTEINAPALEKTQEKNVTVHPSETLPSFDWQKDILMQALDKLEDNIQLDDSHPLDKWNAAPIESFEEALIELSFLKKSNFGEIAAKAQANITPAQAIPLFCAADL